MKNILYFSCFLLFLACKSEIKIKDNNTSASESIAMAKVNLPSISQELIADLLNNCDQVDFIFHYQSFSMNISEKSTIVSHLKGISPNAVKEYPNNCKAQGRIAYYSKGEMLAETDLYFDKDCKLMLFMENEKPVSGNYLNNSGIDFLNNLFAQIEKQ